MSNEKQYEVEWYYNAGGTWVGNQEAKRVYARSPEAAIKIAFNADNLEPGEVYYVRELPDSKPYKITGRRVTIKIEEGEE